MNKINKQILENYKKSEYYSLNQKYKSCSFAKIKAEQEILQDMKNLNGYNYKIVGANTSTFSCAFTFEENNKQFLKYFTRSKIKIFEVE